LTNVANFSRSSFAKVILYIFAGISSSFLVLLEECHLSAY